MENTSYTPSLHSLQAFDSVAMTPIPEASEDIQCEFCEKVIHTHNNVNKVPLCHLRKSCFNPSVLPSLCTPPAGDRPLGGRIRLKRLPGRVQGYARRLLQQGEVSQGGEGPEAAPPGRQAQQRALQAHRRRLLHPRLQLPEERGNPSLFRLCCQLGDSI